MRNTIQFRAQLRSRTLMEPYTASLRWLQRHQASDPVVLEPSPSQQQLEGLILYRLEHLLDRSEVSYNPNAPFAPVRVHAETNHLVIESNWVSPSKLFGLMATWMPEDETPENGIPMLRFRDYRGGRGLTFYIPKRDGAVTFTGINRDLFVHDASEILATSGLAWGAVTEAPAEQEERAWASWRSLNEYVAASVISRRIGLFLAAEPRWVHAWWNQPGRISVELGVHDDAPNPIPLLLSRLLSDDLSPRLILDTQFRVGDDHIPLRIEGTEEEIDLRLLRVRR